MGSKLSARWWHAATAVAAAFALLAQLVLVLAGAAVLVEDRPPPLGTQLVRLASYFTIQSNVVVLVAAASLARRPDRDGGFWRVVRLAGLTGITVTGLVHWVLLRPLLHLTGWSYAVDKLLHVVVPLLAVVGWLLFGPRPRVTLRVAALSLVWPLVWLAYTLVMGAVVGWYPYPFLDVREQGAAAVAAAGLGITVVFVAVSAVFGLGDRRLPA